MQTLTANKYKIVARYLALGVPLEDVCTTLGFSLQTWTRIISEPLFKEELSRIQKEIEDRIVEDAVSDPVHAKLKAASVKATNLLIAEVENNNPEEGANAGTRIKAANSILDRAGYTTGIQQSSGVNITFQLSKDKLNFALSKAGAVEPQPDIVNG